MANTREIQEQNEKYRGYHENHKCDVHDFLDQAAPGKEGAGGYRAVFLYPSGHAGADHPASAGGTASVYFRWFRGRSVRRIGKKKAFLVSHGG